VGYQDINNQGFQNIKPPPPLCYHDHAKTSQEITIPKTSLDASEFLHHYLEEFSYIHPLVEGFLEIKPPPPPALWNLPETTSPGSKTFVKSKAHQKRIPSHHGYPEMERKG